MNIVIPRFLNIMSKPQRIAGYIYLPLHVLILPILLAMLGVYLPGGMSLVTLNVVYYAFGFSYCLIFMWRYLRLSYDLLMDNLGGNIATILQGYLLSMLLGYLFSYLLSAILIAVFGDEAANPNNELVTSLANVNPRAIMGLAVFAAPVVEEVLFRGVIFGSIRSRNRFWAFAVSILAFGLYHVWQLALVEMDWRLLVYVLQYVPLGYALGWVYEKTGNIWAPIFFHMLNNALAMVVLS